MLKKKKKEWHQKRRIIPNSFLKETFQILIKTSISFFRKYRLLGKCKCCREKITAKMKLKKTLIEDHT